jgi:hypothetical protein
MRHAGKNTQTIYTYNDLVIGQIFGSISLKNLSVITFYATVVLAIGRLIRGIFDQIIMKVFGIIFNSNFEGYLRRNALL